MDQVTCTICGRADHDPYRRILDGRIVEGCVATVHDAHIPRPSASAEWVSSAERKFRAAGHHRLSGCAA